MEKRCNKCSVVKIKETDFPQKGKNKSGVMRYHGICKRCKWDAAIEKRKAKRLLQLASKPTPEEKRQLLLAKRKINRFNGKIWLDDYKRKLSCLDCGMSFKERPWLCDFHHRDPSTKESAISKMNLEHLTKVKEELEKCDPLCANCHRNRHFQEGSTEIIRYELN